MWLTSVSGFIYTADDRVIWWRVWARTETGSTSFGVEVFQRLTSRCKCWLFFSNKATKAFHCEIVFSISYGICCRLVSLERKVQDLRFKTFTVVYEDYKLLGNLNAGSSTFQNYLLAPSCGRIWLFLSRKLFISTASRSTKIFCLIQFVTFASKYRS